MVAGHTQGRTRGDHPHHQAQDAGGVGATIDEVADEDRLSALGVRGPVVAHLPAELGEERAQLGDAAVDVADDVEGPGDVALVVPRPLAHDLCRGDLLDAAQDVDAAKALPLELAARTL